MLTVTAEPPGTIVPVTSSESVSVSPPVSLLLGSIWMTYVPDVGSTGRSMPAGDERRSIGLGHRQRELNETARIGRHEIPRLEREIRHRLADWRTMLGREVPEAREILRNLVVGRIVFKPRRRLVSTSSPGGGR